MAPDDPAERGVGRVVLRRNVDQAEKQVASQSERGEALKQPEESGRGSTLFGSGPEHNSGIEQDDDAVALFVAGAEKPSHE